MTAYVRAAVVLAEKFQCTVLIVHHCGYDTSHPRGHTSLIGAVDVDIEVTKGETGEIRTEVKNMRDGENGAPTRSRLEPIEVAIDDNGDLIVVFQPVPSTSGTVAGAGQAAEANRNEQRPGDVTGDFEKRRDAARRQSSYCRRRRLGQITVAVVVSVPDLTAAALRRGLLGSAGATREDLERIAAVIIAEAMRR